MNQVSKKTDSGIPPGPSPRKEKLPLPFRSILHPTDLGPERMNAFYHALLFSLTSRCQLDILNITSPTYSQEASPFPSIRKTLVDWKKIPPGDVTTDVCDLGIIPRKMSTTGSLIPTVVEAMKRETYDLLVLSTHNYKTRSKSFVGSKAEIIARRSEIATLFIPCDCPGFIQPDSGEVTLKRILMPVAENPHPQLAVSKLSALLQQLALTHCEVVLLFIGKQQKFPRLQLTGMVGVQWLQLCRRGSLTETILEFSEGWNPDLVVMPTSSNLKSEGSVFASQTERVLRDCHCPLLALPVR